MSHVDRPILSMPVPHIDSEIISNMFQQSNVTYWGTGIVHRWGNPKSTYRVLIPLYLSNSCFKFKFLLVVSGHTHYGSLLFIVLSFYMRSLLGVFTAPKKLKQVVLLRKKGPMTLAALSSNRAIMVWNSMLIYPDYSTGS